MDGDERRRVAIESSDVPSAGELAASSRGTGLISLHAIAGAVFLAAGFLAWRGTSSDAWSQPLRSGRGRRSIAVAVTALGLIALSMRSELETFWHAASVDYAVIGAAAAALVFAFAYIRWSASTHRSRIESRIARALDVVLFNLLVAAAGLELSLRLFVPLSNNPLLLPESAASRSVVEDIHARLERRAGVTLYGEPFNSTGFRDDEFERPKPDGVFRAVALADSFGVIANVPPSHFHMNLLESEMRDAIPGQRFEVANLGISATGPHHYLAVLEEIGAWLQPDLVMVYFFVGNDFGEQTRMEQNFNGRLDAILLARVLGRVGRFLATDTTGFDLPAATVSPAVPAYVDDWRLETPTTPLEEYLSIAERRAYVFDGRTDAQLFDNAIANLERICERAQRLTGRAPVLVVIPDEMQVSVELGATIEKRRGVELDFERPSRVIAKRLGDHFIIIDLLESLRSGQRESGRVYHLQNSHWNANGNATAAAEIARRLNQHPEIFSR